MMTASVYGAVFKIKAITTKTGKKMCMGTMACKLPVVKSEDGEEHTQWIRLITFDEKAEELEKLGERGYVSAFGRLQISKWVKDGKEVETLQMVADGLVTARTSRPKGGRKKTRSQGTGGYAQGTPPVPSGVTPPSGSFQSPDDPFNDPIPF